MNRKALVSLQGIATMIRDREMAELARLTAQRRALEEDRAAVAREAGNARRAGAESLVTARAAEAFDTWSTARGNQITAQLAQLQPAIDAQKQSTAKAVGRHKNITEIGKKLADDLRKKAGRVL